MLAERTRPGEVWAGRNASGFGERIDFECFGEAAAPAEIGLDHVDTTGFDKLEKRVAAVMVFPGGDRHPGYRTLQFLVTPQVVGDEWFF